MATLVQLAAAIDSDKELSSIADDLWSKKEDVAFGAMRAFAELSRHFASIEAAAKKAGNDDFVTLDHYPVPGSTVGTNMRQPDKYKKEKKKNQRGRVGEGSRVKDLWELTATGARLAKLVSALKSATNKKNPGPVPDEYKGATLTPLKLALSRHTNEKNYRYGLFRDALAVHHQFAAIRSQLPLVMAKPLMTEKRDAAGKAIKRDGKSVMVIARHTHPIIVYDRRAHMKMEERPADYVADEWPYTVGSFIKLSVTDAILAKVKEIADGKVKDDDGKTIKPASDNDVTANIEQARKLVTMADFRATASRETAGPEGNAPEPDIDEFDDQIAGFNIVLRKREFRDTLLSRLRQPADDSNDLLVSIFDVVAFLRTTVTGRSEFRARYDAIAGKDANEDAADKAADNAEAQSIVDKVRAATEGQDDDEGDSEEEEEEAGAEVA